jgi:hypothetical protein
MMRKKVADYFSVDPASLFITILPLKHFKSLVLTISRCLAFFGIQIE